MQPLLGLVDANKTLAIFSAFFWSFLQIFAKRVYELNFACFLVISTLIFCSLCLMFSFFVFQFFGGGLPHRKGVCILVFLIFFNALIVTLIQSGG